MTGPDDEGLAHPLPVMPESVLVRFWMGEGDEEPIGPFASSLPMSERKRRDCLRRYWRDPEAHRARKLAYYYRNRRRILARQRAYKERRKAATT